MSAAFARRNRMFRTCIQSLGNKPVLIQRTLVLGANTFRQSAANSLRQTQHVTSAVFDHPWFALPISSRRLVFTTIKDNAMSLTDVGPTEGRSSNRQRNSKMEEKRFQIRRNRRCRATNQIV